MRAPAPRAGEAAPAVPDGPAPAAPRGPRVMQLINSFSLAGAELVASTLAGGLPAGWDSLVCAVGPSGSGDEAGVRAALESRGIRTFALAKDAGRGPLGAVLRLRRILARERVDLLHTHCESPDTLGRIACLGLPVIHVTTLHNHRPWSGRERIGWAIERMLSPRTAALVACAPGMEAALRWMGFPAARTHAIPNGIDSARFRPMPEARAAWLARLALPADAHLLVSVGRVSFQKGHDVLVRALAAMAQRARPVRLVIAGSITAEPAHFARVKALAEEFGVEDRVDFLGPIPDVPTLLAAADLVVMPSRWEGLSLALLEALACGRPVVATAIPANLNLMPPETRGWLVPAEDPAALAARMDAVLDRPEAEAPGCQAARRAVEEGFSELGMLRAYADLYARLLAG